MDKAHGLTEMVHSRENGGSEREKDCTLGRTREEKFTSGTKKTEKRKVITR